MIRDLNSVYQRASGTARGLHFRDFEKIGRSAFFLNFDTVKSSDCSRHYIWHGLSVLLILSFIGSPYKFSPWYDLMYFVQII